MNHDDARPSPVTTMRRGYVAILDVLGWKGIWKRHEVSEVLDAVQIVRAAAELIDTNTKNIFPPLSASAIAQAAARGREIAAKHPDNVRSEFEQVMQRVQHGLPPSDGIMCSQSVFLSDTLVLGTWTPEVWGQPMATTLEPTHRLWLSMSIAMALQGCALAPVPLVFRGAIAGGSFLIDQNLILGQAVDDAAELMDEANAAIVWFAPPGFAEPPNQQMGHYLD